jgi:hypothetical protein
VSCPASLSPQKGASFIPTFADSDFLGPCGIGPESAVLLREFLPLHLFGPAFTGPRGLDRK